MRGPRTRSIPGTGSTSEPRRRREKTQTVLAIIAMLATACGSRPSNAVARMSPDPRASPAPRITVEFAATPDGACCVVTSVNPQPDAQTVGCLVSAFDDTGHLLASHIVPPIPPGHRRSSGFVAPPGRHVQGAFDLPPEFLEGEIVATCRPAAWHGGAPI